MDILSKEECQEIIDFDHVWEAVELTRKNGGKIKLKEAPFNMWSNHYSDILKEVVIKYEIGDFHSQHIDSPWRTVNPNYHAYYVWITPLNGGYEGGELYLDGEIIEQVVGVPIKFLRTTQHEVTEITKGTRYSLVSWGFVKNLEGSWFNDNKILGE